MACVDQPAKLCSKPNCILLGNFRVVTAAVYMHHNIRSPGTSSRSGSQLINILKRYTFLQGIQTMATRLYFATLKTKTLGALRRRKTFTEISQISHSGATFWTQTKKALSACSGGCTVSRFVILWASEFSGTSRQTTGKFVNMFSAECVLSWHN